MANKIMQVRTVVAIGIGTALFFVLMRFVAIPSGVPNTNLSLGIAVLSIFAAIFGPLAGLLIGFIGHTLVDLTWGSVWWSWVIADAAFGLLVGLFWKLYKIEEGEFGIKNCLVFNLVQIVANAAVWAGLAPTLDILIYKEPADKVFLQGLVAGGLNAAVVLVLGSILAFGYSKTRVRAASLKKEEESTMATPAPSNKEASYFDGGLLSYIGWSILGFIVTVCTLGICFPWALCMVYRWQTNHTVIDGRRLKFNGTAISLFGHWLLWIFLTIITLGIYSFWLFIALKKWITKNTTFADV